MKYTAVKLYIVISQWVSFPSVTTENERLRTQCIGARCIWFHPGRTSVPAQSSPHQVFTASKRRQSSPKDAGLHHLLPILRYNGLWDVPVRSLQPCGTKRLRIFVHSQPKGRC